MTKYGPKIIRNSSNSQNTKKTTKFGQKIIQNFNNSKPIKLSKYINNGQIWTKNYSQFQEFETV